MHTHCLKLWALLCQWRERRSCLFKKAFLALDFNETTDFVEEATAFFDGQK